MRRMQQRHDKYYSTDLLARKSVFISAVALLIVVLLSAMLITPRPAQAIGTRTIAEVTGVTRSGLVSWLESHRFDTYYVATPYIGGDWRSPTGDPSFNGSPGMNCTGFVWHAYTAAGASGVPAMTGWITWINAYDLEHYPFYSKAEMLASGVLERGDIIWIWDGDPYALSDYHHVGIFWGSNPSEDLFWHSSSNYGGNYVTPIVGKGTSADLFTVIKTENRGYIDLVKTSTKPEVTAGNSDFSLAHATFSIYTNAAASGSAVATMVTDENGFAKSGALSAGTYYVKETQAPRGFELNASIYAVSVKSGQTTRVNGVGGSVSNIPLKGDLDLVKVSGWPQISQGNSCYALEGAQYRVYSDAACTQQVTTMTTDTAGKAISAKIDAGTYYVKESRAAVGYALDTQAYQVRVHPAQTTRVNGSIGQVTDMPQHNPVEIVLSKIDSETRAGEPQGGASLAGAQFEIKYYAGHYPTSNTSWMATAQPRSSWVMATDESGYVFLDPDYVLSGDDLVIDGLGRATFPLGTLTIKEIKAPEGYMLSDTPLVVVPITSQGSDEVVSTFVAPIIADQVKRGDIELIKADEASFVRLRDIPFALTSVSNGERHLIVTDANGYASTAASWNPHGQNTNEGKSPDDGVWFGCASALDETKGSLPYDTYIVEELACDGNAGRALIPPFEIVISRDIHVVSLGTLLNSPPAVPSIVTGAREAGSGTALVSAGGQAEIIDRVTYSDLFADTSYQLRGVLMDKTTGSPLLIDGEEIWVGQSFRTGSALPTSKVIAGKVADQQLALVNGFVEMAFSFDASDLEEIDLVVFEYLYLDDELVCSHEDIDEIDQTIGVVPIGPLPHSEEETVTIEVPPPSIEASAPPILPSVAEIPEIPSTGDGAEVFLMIGLLCLCGAALGVISHIMSSSRRW